MSMWAMSISPEHLRQKAQILQNIRAFFAARNVIEVDVPVLCQAGVTDPYLDNFSTAFMATGQPQTYYLQTSPEYALKRMLASGAGDIYAMAKAFRHEPESPEHNPEFMMLEWYRVGWDDRQLMQEVDALLQHILTTPAGDYLAYDEAFAHYCQLNIWDASQAELIAAYGREAQYDLQAESRDHILQLLFAEHIEPHIGQDKPCFVYDFPASQAALARIDETHPNKARRFEVYYKGIELANGYHELTDADLLQARWLADNAQRQHAGLRPMAFDERLLAAQRHGLPECAGVALGVDRLIMLALGVDTLQDILSFPFTQA